MTTMADEILIVDRDSARRVLQWLQGDWEENGCWEGALPPPGPSLKEDDTGYADFQKKTAVWKSKMIRCRGRIWQQLHPADIKIVKDFPTHQILDWIRTKYIIDCAQKPLYDATETILNTRLTGNENCPDAVKKLNDIETAVGTLNSLKIAALGTFGPIFTCQVILNALPPSFAALRQTFLQKKLNGAEFNVLHLKMLIESMYKIGLPNLETKVSRSNNERNPDAQRDSDAAGTSSSLPKCDECGLPGVHKPCKTSAAVKSAHQQQLRRDLKAKVSKLCASTSARSSASLDVSEASEESSEASKLIRPSPALSRPVCKECGKPGFHKPCKAKDWEKQSYALRSASGTHKSGNSALCHFCGSTDHPVRECQETGAEAARKAHGAKMRRIHVEKVKPASNAKPSATSSASTIDTYTGSDDERTEFLSLMFTPSDDLPVTASGRLKNWVISTTATSHFTYRRDWLSDYKAIPHIQVRQVIGEPLTAIGKGSLRIESSSGLITRLIDVLYVPELVGNLFSFSKLDKIGGSFVTGGGCGSMQLNNRDVVGTVTKLGGLYCLTECRTLVNTEDSSNATNSRDREEILSV